MLTNWNLFFFNVYFRDRERQSMSGGGSEGGRHRIRNRLEAPSCQHRARTEPAQSPHRARRGAQTHRPRDHDLSRSRPLNRLSHPGAPRSIFFKPKAGKVSPPGRGFLWVKGGGPSAQKVCGKGIILDLKRKGRHYTKMTLG